VCRWDDTGHSEGFGADGMIQATQKSLVCRWDDTGHSEVFGVQMG